MASGLPPAMRRRAQPFTMQGPGGPASPSQPCCQHTHSAGDPLGLPLTPHTLPRPYPDLHRLPSGCNTNHPVPAEREEPPNPPCSFGQGGVSPVRGTPNYLRPLGWVRARGRQGGHGGGRGSGTVASLSAEATSPFCISVGCWRGTSVPHTVPGAGGWQWGWRGFPSTAGWVGCCFFFHCTIIITTLCVFDFSIKPSAQPCWLPGGWQLGCVTMGVPRLCSAPCKK